MNFINFVNLPNQTTPLNATNLNQLQANVNEGKVDRSLYTSVTDYDNLTPTGLYYMGGNATNSPSSGSFYVEVYKYSDNYICQIATRASNASNGVIQYIRQKYNGTWTNWYDISEYYDSWTPVVNTRENARPTTTYTAQKGSYKRIGNMVFVSFYLRGKITSLNGTNNYATISGLPFTPKEYSMGECSLSTGISYNLLTTTDAVQMCLSRSYSGMLYVNRNNGAGAGVLKVSGDTDFQIGGSGWYETA